MNKQRLHIRLIGAFILTISLFDIAAKPLPHLCGSSHLIYSKSEQVNIDGEVRFQKQIPLPPGGATGTYDVILTMIDENGSTEVLKKKLSDRDDHNSNSRRTGGVPAMISRGIM